MGGIPSRISGHFFTRTKQRFNIESRTEKLLKQDKLPPAPRYQSDEETIQKVRQELPSALDEIRTKDINLHESLKQVSLKSTSFCISGLNFLLNILDICQILRSSRVRPRY
jgi:hypothetical protein